MMKSFRFLFILLFFFCFSVEAAEVRIAILGDSIAYDGKWPAYLESALRQNPKIKNAQIINFGLPSETASGLSEEGHAGGAFPRPVIHERLSRILNQFKPTLVIACYGINDGIYKPFSEDRFTAYREGITKLKKDVEQTGAKIILITPPVYQPDSREQVVYDQVMDAYAKWLVAQRKNGWLVVDMRPALKKSIADAKKHNPDFIYAHDGLHPGEEGHKMIAKAIWPGIAGILNLKKNITFPQGGEFNAAYSKHGENKIEWLKKTRHTRPQIPGYFDGLPEGHTKSNWNSFIKHDFKVNGRNAFIVLPKSLGPNNRWIWRTEFFGHEPQADIALIEAGFAAAYVDMQNLYGSPDSMKIMDDFHQYVCETYGLCDQVVLEGFSRGGLFAFNWAARRPGKVAAIYADAPVCDFKSWPGGKGKSNGSDNDWKTLQAAYGFENEKEALRYKKNPVDNLAPLAKAGIPILIVAKTEDSVVPIGENTDIVEQRYKKLGGKINVIRGPGDHHPHSLKDPAPIVDFILKETGAQSTKKNS